MPRKAERTGVSKSESGGARQGPQRMMNRVHTLLAITAVSAAIGCHLGGEPIGPEGGVVVSEDGRFSLSIPAGALDREVTITVEQVECQRPEAMGPCYDVQPHGTAFTFPAEVAFEIADMDLAGVEPSTLGVVTERDDGWRVLADRDVDLEDEVVYASATYLSSFELMPVVP